MVDLFFLFPLLLPADYVLPALECINALFFCELGICSSVYCLWIDRVFLWLRPVPTGISDVFTVSNDVTSTVLVTVGVGLNLWEIPPEAGDLPVLTLV